MSTARYQALLKTPRLLLRPLTQETMDHIFQEMKPKEARQFLGLKSSDEYASEKKKYNEGLSTYNRKFLYHHLIDQKTMKVIGWCGFHTWYTQHNRAEIGYVMTDENYKNQGLMSEALIAILAFGFNEMGLNRIEAYVADDNEPSLKLLKKFNFKKEGVLRQHYAVNGIAEDSILFSLLKEEFKRPWLK